VVGPIVGGHHVVDPLNESVSRDGVFFSLTPKFWQFRLFDLQINAAISPLYGLSVVDRYTVVTIVTVIVSWRNDDLLVVHCLKMGLTNESNLFNKNSSF
jgi:hypothetical protein